MSNIIGKTLGSYRILEQVGVGGMATVYKAYQPGMDRHVAVKVLPQYLSKDEQFARRFQREARAIAKLEHPHILPIYDYGEADDITYIAMRFVDAGTLKQRIGQDPLRLDEVNRIVGQIGSALDYAHRMGVIHRDVKPANVLIDAEGNTYLTDFGLARMMEASDQLTASGVGVGTPAYMSPEQGQGVKVDHRSDVYSLGVILFELVTGHVPYEAETPMAVMLKHITDPLPLPRTVNPHVPEPVELVILKALAKDPAHRFQTAGEMVEALGAAVRKVSVAEVRRPVAAEVAPEREEVSLITRLERVWKQPRGKVSLIGGAVVVIALLALVLSQLPGQVQIVGPGAATPTSALTLATATTGKVAQAATPTLARPTVTSLPATPAAPAAPAAIVPCRVAFVDKASADTADIFVQNCDGSNRRLVTEGRLSTGHEPAWSPDGQRLVFDEMQAPYDPNVYVPTYLYIVNADGSNRIPITALEGPVEGNFPVWSPDGARIAWQRGCEIMTIRPDGSDLVTVLAHRELSGEGDPEMCVHRPMWSPDSQRFAFATFPLDAAWDPSIPGPYEYRFYVVNADGTNLIKLDTFMLEVPPRGVPVEVAWSPDGKQVAFEMTVNDRPTMKRYLMGSDGSGEMVEIHSIPESWRPWYWPQWGGEAQAATARCRTIGVDQKQEYDLFVQDCDGSNKRRLTMNRGFGSNSPSWSPDGQRIVFDALFGQELGQGDLYLINADGSNQTLFLEGGEGGFGNPAWSPDGERIAYMDGCNIKTIRLDGSDKTTIVKRTDMMNHSGDPEMCVYEVAWSPDSQRLAVWAWQLGESLPGPREERIAVVNADGTGLIDVAAFQMKEGNATPYWSPDGSQVAYLLWENNKARYYIVNGDGSNQPEEIGSIADSWSQSHWPQWDRDVQSVAPTLSPQAEQARVFAEPILQAIANRQPDFEDDFSKRNAGWMWLGNNENGQPAFTPEEVPTKAFNDGSLTLTVADGVWGNTWTRACDHFNDFVLQADLTLVDLANNTSGRIEVYFRLASGENYVFGFELDGSGWYAYERKHSGRESITLGTGGMNMKVNGKDIPNRLLLVAHGPRFAAYVNDMPLTYFENADIPAGEGACNFGFGAAPGSVTISIDNVKAWNLANVPGLPATSALTPQAEQARAFAGPILQAIADRKPDFEDDFSTADKGWRWEEPSGSSVAIKDGVLSMGTTDTDTGLWAKHELFSVPDFALQLDFRPMTVLQDAGVAFGFRDTNGPVYGLEFYPDYSTWGAWCVACGGYVELGKGNADEVRIGLWTKLLIIARGAEFAIYLNDKPFTYFSDDTLPRGLIRIGMNSRGHDTTVEFDNVKFWNLDNVPGLP